MNIEGAFLCRKEILFLFGYYFCSMYSRQEASLLNQEFWTALGQYMSPILSAEGERINWINYKTGEKNIRFIMQAENKTASVSIQLNHKDHDLQRFNYEKLLQLKKILHTVTGVVWQWQPLITDQHGCTISIVFVQQDDVSIFNKDQWPQLISFFKTNMIALDKFWCENKFAFER